jgi:hypothetical protein
VATANIYNGEPPKAETKRTGKENTLIIGPPMDQRYRHPFDVIQADGAAIHEVVLTTNSAH